MEEVQIHTTTGGRNNRRVINYVLEPVLQTKLALYFIGLTVIFMSMFAGLLHVNFSSLLDMAIRFSSVGDEIRGLIADTVSAVWLQVSVLMIVFILSTLLGSVIYTHRMVGPIRAYRRHVRSLIDGKFDSRVKTRKDDAFLELAADLNELAEVLKKRG